MNTIYKSETGKNRILELYETYVKSLNHEFEREYVDTRYGKTHLLVGGPKEGKPIFVFHGGNCVNPVTLSWFSSLLSKYRVYAPDTIGHPGYSAENRMSGKDNSFALWIEDLMSSFKIDQCAMVGASFGGGVILRAASHIPEKISCTVLVSPAGITLGSKVDMIRKVLIPMLAYKQTSSDKSLQKVSDSLSNGNMKLVDKNIIGEIFKSVKLERDMPRLTRKEELVEFGAPTLLITGNKDIFFPAEKVVKRAKEIIPSLEETKIYDMGHFPAEHLHGKINEDILTFLNKRY